MSSLPALIEPCPTCNGSGLKAGIALPSGALATMCSDSLREICCPTCNGFARRPTNAGNALVEALELISRTRMNAHLADERRSYECALMAGYPSRKETARE